MVGKDRDRVMVNIERALRDRLGLMRDRYNSERGNGVSESRFMEMCLSEYVNANRDRWGGVRISDGDKDFD